MAKAFTDQEKEYIKRQLLEAAKVCLKLYGIKKTTVDELTRRCQISKGAFYTFYKTKELLFWDVMNMLHEAAHLYMDEAVNRLDEISSEGLAEALFNTYKYIYNTFPLVFLENSEIEYLIRKLPQEVIEEHHAEDRDMIQCLKPYFPKMTDEDSDVLTGSLRLIFLGSMHADEVGQGIFDKALKLSLEGIINTSWNQVHEED